MNQKGETIKVGNALLTATGVVLDDTPFLEICWRYTDPDGDTYVRVSDHTFRHLTEVLDYLERDLPPAVKENWFSCTITNGKYGLATHRGVRKEQSHADHRTT